MPSLILALLAALCLALPFGGCAKNPFEDESRKAGDPEDSSFVLAQGALQGSARAAADLHQEASAGDRVEEGLAAAAEPEVKAAAGGTTIGAPKGDPVLSKGTQPKSMAAGALLKSGPGLAKASSLAATAFLADTLVLSDSAEGWVYGLRAYAFSDTAGGRARTGEGRDSTRFRWPHAAAHPVVLSFHRRRVLDDGTVETASAHDDDGDGLLSEAAAGKAVRLRREWSTRRGDSAWLARVLTEHGQTTRFDSLGAGKARSWSDTLKVGGKVAWWRKVYDADGDGLVAGAAAGGTVKIGSDSYADLGGGRIRFATEIHGPGPDLDYARDADNERYAASGYTVDAEGRDVNRSLSGDLDGDGLLWSPASGAANRSWETTAWLQPPAGWKTYKDSAAKAADGRISAYRAEGLREDGARLVLEAASPDGAAAFGPADTVLLTERLAHPAGDAQRRDSTVRIAHVIPGRLDLADDDLLLRWSLRVHFNAASGVSLREETFVAEEPVAPGAEAPAGSLVVEERLRAQAAGAPVRTWKRRDFDQAAGTSQWKEIKSFADGDSTVAAGRRAADGGGYLSRTGRGLKVSGRYDPVTGAFQDTVSWLDTLGAQAGSQVTAGTLKGGAGAFTRIAVRADGKRTEIQGRKTCDAQGTCTLTRVTDSDSAVYAFRGDSVTIEKSFGAVKVALACVRSEPGAYTVTLAGKESGGALRLTGTLEFGRDGRGSGSLVELAGGKPGPGVSFRSEPDGRVRVGDRLLP